jgi:uncharacterized protein YecE (DUF72 family)
MSVRIGTSGWSYKEWEGVFYPDAKTPKLSYYSKVFDTAEIDSTFYANPARGLVFGWARNTPSNFEFAVKLPQLITHKKKLDLSLGVEVDLRNFLDLLKPLHDSKKLGPLLIQLPPSFDTRKKETLETFLEALPKDHLFAIEFRNKSWLNDTQLYSLLRKYNVANTIVDEPLLPVDLTLTSDFTFIRWHGWGKRIWYDYHYSEKELEPWVERVKSVSSKAKKVYGYFNNHFHGYAIENGLWLLDKIGLANDDQRQTLLKVRDYIKKNSLRSKENKAGS